MRPCLFSYLDAANIGSLRRRLNHDDELSFFFLPLSLLLQRVRNSSPGSHSSEKPVWQQVMRAEPWVLPPRQQHCLDFLAGDAEDRSGQVGSVACSTRRTCCQILLSAERYCLASFCVLDALSPGLLHSIRKCPRPSPGAEAQVQHKPGRRRRRRHSQSTGWKRNKSLAGSSRLRKRPRHYLGVPPSALEFVVPALPCNCPGAPTWSMGWMARFSTPRLPTLKKMTD